MTSWFTVLYSSFLCCVKWFNIFSFAIPSVALNTRGCLRSFYTLVRLSPPLLTVECKFYLYALRSFMDWCFCSKVDNIILSALTALLLPCVRYTQFTFNRIHCFTLCEFTFAFYVIAASVSFKQFIRAYYEASSVIMAYTHVFLPFFLSFLQHCTLI